MIFCGMGFYFCGGVNGTYCTSRSACRAPARDLAGIDALPKSEALSATKGDPHFFSYD
jgi:hypothetical protein